MAGKGNTYEIHYEIHKICQPWKERKIGVDPPPSPAAPASLIDREMAGNFRHSWIKSLHTVTSANKC